VRQPSNVRLGLYPGNSCCASKGWMPSRVVCDSGHATRLKREAAIEIAKSGKLSRCGICGKARHFFVRQTYAGEGTGKSNDYEVIRVARLLSDREADAQSYDPMILIMRHDEGYELMWPVFWGRDSKRNWRWGQFGPLLNAKGLRRLSEMALAGR